MKYLFFIFLFLNTLYAISEEDKSGLGVGVIISESPYEGIDKKTMVIPLIKYNANDFYIRGIEFGYKIIDAESFKLNYILAPRLESLDSGDSSYLTGMEDRDMTMETGIVLVYKPIPLISLSTKAKFDVLGVHEGYDIGFRVGSFIPVSKSFFISPSYSKVFLSSNLANYYYGVKSSEETSTRSAYDTGDATIDIYSINFIYKLSDSISTNFMLSQSIRSQELKDSPIIKDKNTKSYIMGVSYTF